MRDRDLPASYRGTDWIDPDDAALHRYDPIFWSEAVAISAFRVSWFVAGKAFRFLKDPVQYRPSERDEFHRNVFTITVAGCRDCTDSNVPPLSR